MQTEAQKKAMLKYRKNKVVRRNIDIFPTEQDILQRLDEVKKQNGEGTGKYVKRLIREDIEREKHS